MKTVKISVGLGGKAGIICPYCQKNHQVSVAKFKGSKHNLVTKCTCQNQFKVELNFRQLYRKNVKLVGEFINISTGSTNCYMMTVVDLSMMGLRFRMVGSTDIKQGHKLRVKFTLDNKKATSIEKEVSVLDVRNEHYGCKFSNKDFEKELGFYLQT